MLIFCTQGNCKECRNEQKKEEKTNEDKIILQSTHIQQVSEREREQKQKISFLMTSSHMTSSDETRETIHKKKSFRMMMMVLLFSCLWDHIE